MQIIFERLLRGFAEYADKTKIIIFKRLRISDLM